MERIRCFICLKLQSNAASGIGCRVRYHGIEMSPQNPDDRPFRHYSTKHRIVSWISQNLFDNVTYTVRRGLLKGMKRRGGTAWLPESIVAEHPTAEHSFWKSQNLKGLTIYDVGAFHGLLTMFFARQGQQVISFEPNSKNRARLQENLRLNGIGNVTVRPFGAGAKKETVTMVASASMLGGASIDRDAVAGIMNSNQPVITEEIPITTLDDDIHEQALPAPEFIKIDVEGGELGVLQGGRNTLLKHHPLMFLEMHGETMNLKRKNVAAIVDCLNDLGYTDIEHIETGTKINPANSAVAAEGHLFCR